jgi:Aminoglycoside-2''-adenylyltransferase
MSHDGDWPGLAPGPSDAEGPVQRVTEQSSDFDRGLSMVASAAGALDASELEHWFFGGWAVDLWVGRLTRPHDDIDVLVWREDEARVHEALQGAGWVHTPTPEDLVGTNYARDGYELQLTFVVAGPQGGVVVPVPEQPIVLSRGPLAFARRKLNDVSVRVLTLEMMLATKGTPRPDEVGGAKDRADLEALRSLAESAS